MDKANLKSTDESGLLRLYAELMEELRNRQIIRSSNNPVSDYGEKVTADKLNLIRAGKEEKGYDAFDSDGYRYQIKARRTTKHNKPTRMGVIRNLDDRLFDYLVAVIFDEHFSISEMWRASFAFVKDNAVWDEIQNGHILYIRSFSEGDGIERII